MNIDVADPRELTVYRRDAWLGAPELSLAGLLLLPAFGAGAILLGFNFLKCRKQQFVVSHLHFWHRGSSPLATQISCKRSDVVAVEVRQSWLQAKLGSGDLIIQCKDREAPIVVEAIPNVQELAKRLLTTADRNYIPAPHYLKVKVGTTRWAPKPPQNQSVAA